MNSTMREMQAGLIIVYASSGRTASLVAKYRPKMPILTLVVPHLKSSALKWELQGRSLARQCLIMRGQSLVHLHICCVVTLICGR
jgi:pyruvate kinase